MPMRSTTTSNRGEVLLLPFPFTDQSGTKQRPALVLSTTLYNQRREDLIVAPITSNVATGQPDDITLNDWTMAGLLKPSLVIGILGTIDQELVIRRLGVLNSTDLSLVERAFMQALGFQIEPHAQQANPP